jgi:hypothetical protein
MNKHLGAKKRPAKPRRNTGTRKPTARKAAPRKTHARVTAKKRAPTNGQNSTNGQKMAAISITQVSTSISAGHQVRISHASASQLNIGSMNVSAVAAIGQALLSHKYRVGQTVFYTSSPISRPGASGSYRVVRLLPSDGEDNQYRIKHAGEAFERVAKESQLELEG